MLKSLLGYNLLPEGTDWVLSRKQALLGHVLGVVIHESLVTEIATISVLTSFHYEMFCLPCLLAIPPLIVAVSRPDAAAHCSRDYVTGRPNCTTPVAGHSSSMEVPPSACTFEISAALGRSTVNVILTLHLTRLRLHCIHPLRDFFEPKRVITKWTSLKCEAGLVAEPPHGAFVK